MNTMKVRNMTSPNGSVVPNQFIITGTKLQSSRVHEDGVFYASKGMPVEIFQSYQSTIVKKVGGKVYLDINKWDYSVTTGKYRN